MTDGIQEHHKQQFYISSHGKNFDHPKGHRTFIAPFQI